jgi:RNA polymerase sigma-70 factor, ECF subfamily
LKKTGTTLSDEDLLASYSRKRDQRYLAELFSRYTHIVYGVCLKYLQNREDAKDAVMGIYEKLTEEILKYDIHIFGSWLYVLSKNYCLMQIRADKTKSKHQITWEKDQLIFMESEWILHPVDDNTNHNEKSLRECIEKLKKDQKECIKLFYFNDKCYKEIASRLKIDEKTVKSFLQNAKRNLKICLEGKNVRQ